MNKSSGVCTTIKVAVHGGWIMGYAHHDGHVSFMLNGEAVHFESVAEAVKAWPESDGGDPQ